MVKGVEDICEDALIKNVLIVLLLTRGPTAKSIMVQEFIFRGSSCGFVKLKEHRRDAENAEVTQRG